MSKTVMSGEKICKAATNNSKSKMLFSFCKAKRFNEPSSQE